MAGNRQPLRDLFAAFRILVGVAASLLLLCFGGILAAGTPDPPWTPSDAELAMRMALLPVVGGLSGSLASKDRRGAVISLVGAVIIVVAALVLVYLLHADRPPSWVRREGELIWWVHNVLRGVVLLLGFMVTARRGLWPDAATTGG